MELTRKTILGREDYMKKIIAFIISLCLLVGVSGNTIVSVNAKDSSEGYIIETTEEYSENQKEQLKKADHVFSQEELKNTLYAGKHVEVIDGKLYVENRAIGAIVLWLYVSGIPKIIGWMAAGGLVTYTSNKIIEEEAINQIKHAWNTYNDMTDAYVSEQQKLKSIKRSNGRICIVRPNGHGYDCSMR